MKKEYYLEQVSERGKIKIWVVDGSVVRRDIDKEFTNFGQHFRFSSIPEYEFWLDKEAHPNERKFFIDHLLIEWKLMRDGLSYSDACDVADKKELLERKRAGDFKKQSENKKDFLDKKIDERLLGKTDDNVAVKIINGRLVRSVFDIEFTEGGHDFVYDYVPKNEVWLDDDLMTKERPFVLLHELHERELMKKGYDYEKAHQSASKLEWEARHEIVDLEESLKKLGWNRGE